MRSAAAARLPAPVSDLQIADLVRRVERLEGLARRRTRDSVADVAFVSAIAATFGSCVFNAIDLLQHSTHDPELGRLLDGCDARSIGVWLRRLHRHNGEGPYRLARCGRGGGGALWALVDVCGASTYSASTPVY